MEYSPRLSSNTLTFIMTIEYNGFAYAGFQRQTSTPPNNTTKSNINKSTQDSPVPTRKRPHPSQLASDNKKSNKYAPTTVQQQIENALQQWTYLSVATLRVRGAGRTDKGVHASGQVVAFDVPLNLLQLKDACTNETSEDTDCTETISGHALPILQEACQRFQASNGFNGDVSQSSEGKANNQAFIDFWQVRRAISTRLPPDIVIQTVWIWTGTCPFEARQGIACKTYTYKLRFRSLAHVNTTNGDQVVHPICNAGPHLLRRVSDQNNVWLSPWPLDPTILSPACKTFVGTHDFSNFIHKEDKKRAKEKDHTINLLCFDVCLCQEGEASMLPPVYNATFTLKAKGFHRQMIRNLVGFVADVARGLQKLESIPLLLQGTKHSTIRVNAAPACGLSLDAVRYECNSFSERLLKSI